LNFPHDLLMTILNSVLDIDECVERFNNPPCTDLALCTDLEGSFRCGCREGYTGNGTICNGENFILTELENVLLL
jgi:hypothetical protein